MWNQTIHIGGKDALVLQEVPAGEYDLRVSWFYGRFKDAGMSFRVDPGIITYIGDFPGTIDNHDSIGMLGDPPHDRSARQSAIYRTGVQIAISKDRGNVPRSLPGKAHSTAELKMVRYPGGAPGTLEEDIQLWLN